MMYRIEFENGSETHVLAATDKQAREIAMTLYPNKPIATVEESEV